MCQADVYVLHTNVALNGITIACLFIERQRMLSFDQMLLARSLVTLDNLGM